jgi:hypothetical protein
MVRHKPYCIKLEFLETHESTNLVSSQINDLEIRLCSSFDVNLP